MSVESPCIRVCTLDEGGQLCIGCFRTLEEIGLWSQLADAARKAVLERVGERRREYEMQTRAPRWKPEACDTCGAKFSCGAADTANPCWCMSYPPVAPRAADARCLCPSCLAAAARRKEGPWASG